MTPGPKPQSSPRRGASAGLANMPASPDAIDENTLQAAQQMMTSSQGSSGSKSGSKNPLQNNQSRELGSIPEELFIRPAQDIWQQMVGLADITTWLGADNAKDPEKTAKRRQMHQRWQQLTQEEQQVAHQRYQAEMQRKKQQEEERQRKAMQEQQQQQTITAPSSPQKGPRGPAGKSKKQKAQTKLQQDRQRMGGSLSAN